VYGQASRGKVWPAQVSKKDWMESVQLVFDYFCERTPRSFVELRETSVVWNYKYADVEFGRLQARDLLQHLWTGPISNAPVDIVQVQRSSAVSVTVALVGVSLLADLSRPAAWASAVEHVVICHACMKHGVLLLRGMLHKATKERA
jgi:trehalose 6-phosphate synthase/phosphatase